MASNPEEAPELKTYRGNCHCGAFVYEVQLPEIKSAGQCNCSICTKKGYLWAFPSTVNFKVVKGDESELTEYQFGSKNLSHKVWTPLVTYRNLATYTNIVLSYLWERRASQREISNRPLIWTECRVFSCIQMQPI